MRSIFVLLISILAVPLAGCIDDTPDYRYRLKVEVETPEGLKTGSSVIEVETAVSSGIPTPGAIQTRYRGEAVRVDLGERGPLLADAVEPTKGLGGTHHVPGRALGSDN